MSPIYMTHPEHGVHIAYSEQEVEMCKQNGWRLRDEAPAPAPAAPVPGTLKLPRRSREASK